MKIELKSFIYIFTVLCICGCGISKSLDIPGMDMTGFRKDKMGCKEIRKSMIPLLKMHKDTFLGVSENEIFYAIGKYDYQALDTKNEKVLVFFLEKGPQCDNLRNRTEALSLILKLNSVSLVKEVILQKGGYE
ncbi:MAG: hypothetical protein ACRCVT_11555 [Leadbetterella sp.]